MVCTISVDISQAHHPDGTLLPGTTEEVVATQDLWYQELVGCLHCPHSWLRCVNPRRSWMVVLRQTQPNAFIRVQMRIKRWLSLIPWVPFTSDEASKITLDWASKEIMVACYNGCHSPPI